MRSPKSKYVSIIDYGMGNLFSIKNACNHIGLKAIITSEKKVIKQGVAAILPGVGAFGDAMANLRKLDLAEFIKDQVNSGKSFLAICLGMQILFSESEEFGTHRGLDIIKGTVKKFPSKNSESKKLKIPHMAWAQIMFDKTSLYQNNIFKKINNGDYMYFAHSYIAIPEKDHNKIIESEYFGVNFCSGIKIRNLFGFQFHPEKSGVRGLQIYRNFFNSLKIGEKDD